MIAVVLTAEVARWMAGITASGDRALVFVELGKLGLGIFDSLEICGFELHALRLNDKAGSKLYLRKTSERIEVLAVDNSRWPRKVEPEPGDVTELTEFDPVKCLDDEVTIVSYLIESQATRSPEMRHMAVQNASRARFLNHLAMQAGVCRSDAYEFLRSHESLRFEVVTKLLSALKDQRLVSYVMS